MAVFGVDFGTLHAVISVARRGGIDVIVNEVHIEEKTCCFKCDARSAKEKQAALFRLGKNKGIWVRRRWIRLYGIGKILLVH